MTEPNPEDVSPYAADEDENPDECVGEPVDDGLGLDIDSFDVED